MVKKWAVKVTRTACIKLYLCLTVYIGFLLSLQVWGFHSIPVSVVFPNSYNQHTWKQVKLRKMWSDRGLKEANHSQIIIPLLLLSDSFNLFELGNI
jgi:hypothetical protein